MSRNALWILGGLFVVTVVGVQFRQISKLKADLAEIRTEVRGSAQESDPDSGPVTTAADASPRPVMPDGSAGLHARVSNLERTLADYGKISEMMMERGVLPPTEDRVAQLRQKFFDPSATDDEKMRALGVLRRNNQLSDDVLTQTLGMLQSSTNVNFRRSLLQQLDGVTNAALKQPILALLDSGETGDGVREQAVNLLRRFVDDPAVESKLWDLAVNDPKAQVRNQAMEALARGPATPERIDKFLQTAASPDASLDERLLSFRALRLAKAHTPELVNELATMAQGTTDPVARAKLFKSFNGLTDPALMAPLVNGLQDSDPIVRQNAADALSSFSDPRVQEWLNHVIQNDTDPAVKREAHEALEHSQRASRKLVQ